MVRSVNMWEDLVKTSLTQWLSSVANLIIKVSVKSIVSLYLGGHDTFHLYQREVLSFWLDRVPHNNTAQTCALRWLFEHLCMLLSASHRPYNFNAREFLQLSWLPLSKNNLVKHFNDGILTLRGWWERSLSSIGIGPLSCQFHDWDIAVLFNGAVCIGKIG